VEHITRRRGRRVLQVLRAPRGTLVREQSQPVRDAEHHRRHAHGHRVPSRLLEVDTRDLRDDVDATRREAELIDRARLGEVVDRDSVHGQRRAKGTKASDYAIGIGRRGPHEDVEIPGGPYDPVSRERVRAHHEEIHARVHECVEQVQEVIVEDGCISHRSESGGLACRRGCTAGAADPTRPRHPE
jgi:hypothetical protein